MSEHIFWNPPLDFPIQYVSIRPNYDHYFVILTYGIYSIHPDANVSLVSKSVIADAWCVAHKPI